MIPLEKYAQVPTMMTMRINFSGVMSAKDPFKLVTKRLPIMAVKLPKPSMVCARW
mgnify:CR=1 FL=1